ncbi:MAG: peptidoglycan DD-metalloendopeptidase family protein [Xanthomonadaceae bacterium]|jgi:murein DD-endopeptidase MepM/ murein hydrolase activator NlpD|nr:peptidoglycan DD-metalloendopeptidase family protein [Xanthomonadaceae bacterium]MDE2249583.1 peptidoglycan DD-metalloendopeptidase family protein [Xanthomonadaceae bacterium]MDE2308654.1 peptidoglycan DD-metalloendopeptidase family protein [Xanthomonadaceae bacterium]
MADEHLGAHQARKQAICRKAQRRHSRFYERCAHWSFNRSAEVEPIHWHREHWVLAGTAVLITLLSGLIMPAWASAMRPDPVPEVRTLLPLALPKMTTTAAPAVDNWLVTRVEPGQTLSNLFDSHGLGMADVQKVLDAAGSARSALQNIHPGDEFDFLLDRDGNLQALRFDKDDTTRATVRLDSGKPALTLHARTVVTRVHIAHAVIESSLFGAGAKAGLDEGMIVKLADVFKYDIDFLKDIRRGDSFTVVYDDVYHDGVYDHSGDIIAAEFLNHGQRYTAYRFKEPDGSYNYYSEDGRPLRKSLLRTPVAFTRISSRFSMARKHPILGFTRAHKGVDYAAPAGTPIHAAGDGVIAYRGWERGFGNFVLIKHNAEYSTAYAHMSRFEPGERVGTHVHQGQVIGFVGMTGLATGPHLHYEVRVYGKQENPLTVTMPKPQPLPPKLLAQFKQQIQPMLARLKAANASLQLASRDDAASHRE